MKNKLLTLSLLLFTSSVFAQSTTVDSTSIGRYLDGKGVLPPPTVSKNTENQWELQSYVLSSSGAGTSQFLGNHLFCGVSQSAVSVKGQTGGCTIEKVGNDFYLRAKGDSLVNSGRGIDCHAPCIDLVNK